MNAPRAVPCCVCGSKIVPLGNEPICTPCGAGKYGPIVFAVRVACDVGAGVLDAERRVQAQRPKP